MRIKELDALRGLAAIGVFFFHFNFFDYGYLGVHLFFIISGFVIFLTANKVKSSGDFVIARVSRLYPTYWVCVTLTTLVLLVNAQDISFTDYLVNLTMFQMFLGVPNIDGAYWSLTEELVFYGIIFVLIAIGGIKKVNYWLGFMLLAAFGGLFLDYNVGLQKNLQDVVKYFGLFAAGILFYLVYTEEKISMLKVFGLALCLVITLGYDFGRHLSYFNALYENVIVVACFMLFGLLISGKLAFLNKHKWLLFMGQISYPFYLLHQEIGLAIGGFFSTGILYVDFVVVLAVFALITLMAYGITFYFEGNASKALKTRLTVVSNHISLPHFVRGKRRLTAQEEETVLSEMTEPATLSPEPVIVQPGEEPSLK